MHSSDLPRRRKVTAPAPADSFRLGEAPRPALAASDAVRRAAAFGEAPGGGYFGPSDTQQSQKERLAAERKARAECRFMPPRARAALTCRAQAEYNEMLRRKEGGAFPLGGGGGPSARGGFENGVAQAATQPPFQARAFPPTAAARRVDRRIPSLRCSLG